MKSYFFDVECFPNLYMITFRDLKSRENHQFYIYDIEGVKVNDIVNIVKFVQNSALIGFNNKFYDNSMVNVLCKLLYVLARKPISEINTFLFNLSNKIIKEKDRTYKYQLPFKSIDLMPLGGIRVSLKHIGVLLKHELLQELPFHYTYNLRTLEEVNITSKYNINDLDITEKLYYAEGDRGFTIRKELFERLKIEKLDGIRCTDITRSGLSNLLTIKMYEDITGLSKDQFIDLRTRRRDIALKDCISPIIKFKTKELQNQLEEIKKVIINPDDNFYRLFKIGETTYKLAKGGIHDQSKNVIRVKDDNHIIRDADVGSYYPRIIEKFNIFPLHFDRRVRKKYGELIDERLAIKKTNPTQAEMLKIVLNSFYGKYGSDTFFLYDPQAMYGVTLNGQLSLLMLIESLEINGIEVFSANTDGIVSYLHKSKEEDYTRICKKWEDYTQLELEYSDYDKIIMLDCNNYMVISNNEVYKEKGFFFTKFDPAKAFTTPIIKLAVKEYFLNRTPIRKTIEEHKDILDFSSCENSDKKYHYIYYFIDNDQNYKEERFDTAIRFYASKGGGKLVKTEGIPDQKTGKIKEISMLAKQNVTLVNDLNNPYPSKKDIDYNYYVQESLKVINKLINPIEKRKGLKAIPKNQLKLL